MWRDQALVEKLHDGVVHQLHADASAPDQHVEQLGRLALADDGGGRGIADENFIDRQAAFAVGALEEKLGEDSAQRARQHGPDLVLLVGWKNVDDAVDRLLRIVRVQCSVHKQAGFRGGERQGDGFQVPHFTHQHHVGVLPQRGLQSHGE